MPLTAKGREIKSAMEKQYGAEKGEEVFYASKNKGTISGVDQPTPVPALPAGTLTAPSGLNTGITPTTPIRTPMIGDNVVGVRDLARIAGAKR